MNEIAIDELKAKSELSGKKFDIGIKELRELQLVEVEKRADKFVVINKD